ncbi:MAG: histidinol phosphate phosphatase [Rhodospirillaceae bacterium]|nr:MAG: histidinol phosphate phosphatase [Rhodospirillaceae bacterium]
MVTLPNEIWGFAERLRAEAEPVVDRYFRAPDLTVEHKADVSPVTRADETIEQLWRAMITETFPDHGIVGEEGDTVGADRDFIWVLDPIDGTRAFIGGFPLFTNLFALLYRNQPVFGGICAPATGEWWLGQAIEPAWATFRGKPIGNRPQQTLETCVLAATAPDMFSPAQFARFQALSNACADLRYGADAYAYGLVALGTVGIVAEASMNPWDFMALIPVIEGAGGRVTDWTGQPLTLESDGTVLAAATPALHEAALSTLTE